MKKIGIQASVLTSDIKHDKIIAGSLSKDGKKFLSDRQDVTSDCLKAIIEYVGVGKAIEINVNGKPKYEIQVKEIK